jgi:hypothetical protein
MSLWEMLVLVSCRIAHGEGQIAIELSNNSIEEVHVTSQMKQLLSKISA